MQVYLVFKRVFSSHTFEGLREDGGHSAEDAETETFQSGHQVIAALTLQWRSQNV